MFFVSKQFLNVKLLSTIIFTILHALLNVSFYDFNAHSMATEHVVVTVYRFTMHKNEETKKNTFDIQYGDKVFENERLYLTGLFTCHLSKERIENIFVFVSFSKENIHCENICQLKCIVSRSNLSPTNCFKFITFSRKCFK